MPGVGRVPKDKAERLNTSAPLRGEWQSAPGVGWQHGPIPEPPHRMKVTTQETWTTWFQSWFAAHWGPEDLPGLRMVIRLWNAVEGGDFARAGELRQMMDNYGITPKGQQDRRWKRPEKPAAVPDPVDIAKKRSPYDHLRSADE